MFTYFNLDISFRIEAHQKELVDVWESIQVNIRQLHEENEK